MRLLVTGGSGFIGTNLVARCLEDGVPVCTLDPSPPKTAEHRPVWSAGDVTDRPTVEALLRDFRPTHLVHLAAETSQAGRSMTDYAVNVHGVETVLAALTAYGALTRAVLASTRLVTELGVVPVSDFDYCPPNFYGRSKVIGEQLVRAHRGPLEWVLVRPTSIWGPWGAEPYRPFFLSLARGTYVHPRGGPVLKHYGYVGNTVHQLLRLLEAPAADVHGRTFYLADPEPVEVGAFAELIRARMGLPPPRTVPLAVLRAVALGGDAARRTGVLGSPPLTSDRLRNLRTSMLYPMEELAAVVGKPAYTLEEGVDATIAHLEEQGDIAPGGVTR
jgi:GlcNAc-P-P-Und epimerase